MERISSLEVLADDRRRLRKGLESSRFLDRVVRPERCALTLINPNKEDN